MFIKTPTEKKTKVVIAMSGGVDSSVCGLLMKEQGFDCVGMTMRLWSPPKDRCTTKSCCGDDSVEDARLVSEKIGIPYYAINFQREFWKEVVEVFAEEYFEGRTPSPCILCNEKLKFDSLYRKALSVGAEKVCTGHYARIEYDEEKRRWYLLKGVDTRKDQSYFLFGMTQLQLSQTLFPLGSLTKPEIRKMALEAGLVTAKKPESQDICFIPDRDYVSFLKKHFPNKIPKKGLIKHADGTVLGKHEGIHQATVGQRRGLGIAFGKPLYVTQIDRNSHVITLGERDRTYGKEFSAKKMNWIHIDPPVGSSYRLQIKIRAGTQEVPGTVTVLDNGRAKVIFDEPQHAVTPGQATVFYRGDYVFGGGWIEEFDPTSS